MYYSNQVEFKELVGKTLTKVEQVNSDELIFTVDDGNKYKLYHSQDCCECVEIEDICGELEDLVGSPILVAEEVIHDQDENPEGVEIPDYQDSFTWTFYKIDTAKGGVTIRWYGESNGYYSETVDFTKLTDCESEVRH